jgi:hypothetical protein
MHKKGSLELSINAIVILVLAITMLGLGLAFTKGMFSKFSSKLSVPEPDIPATADDPVVTSSDSIQITKGKETAFSANFYNDNFGSDPIIGKLYCSEGGGAAALVACSSAQKVPAAEDKGYQFIIPIKDPAGNPQLAKSANRVCTLGFAKEADMSCSDGTWPEEAVTKQLTVTIK